MRNLVFIGGGTNSAVGRAHYCAAQMDGLFRVGAGCFSRDAKVNLGSGLAYDARPFDTVEGALEWGISNAGVVAVLSPTPDHYQHVYAAMKAGLPVICEKALGNTAHDTARLQHFLRGWLRVTYNYTGYPMVRELRSMLQRGVLGRILHVQVEMPQEGYLREEASPQFWRREDGAIPAIHLDLGTHLHHLLWFITGGRPVEVMAAGQTYSQFGVIDNVSAMARYKLDSDSFHVNLWFSKAALGHRNGLRIRVYGTQGSAEWYQFNPEELAVATPDGLRMTLDRGCPALAEASRPEYQRFKAGHPHGFLEAYANVYADLYADLVQYELGDDPTEAAVTYGPEIAHQGLLMMHALHQSAQEKRWVTL